MFVTNCISTAPLLIVNILVLPHVMIISFLNNITCKITPLIFVKHNHKIINQFSLCQYLKEEEEEEEEEGKEEDE